MATKTVVKLTINLADGRSATVTLNAAPVNNTLIDPDSGESLTPAAATAICAAYESDDGVKAASVTFAIVTTTTTIVDENRIPT